MWTNIRGKDLYKITDPNANTTLWSFTVWGENPLTILHMLLTWQNSKEKSRQLLISSKDPSIANKQRREVYTIVWKNSGRKETMWYRRIFFNVSSGLRHPKGAVNVENLHRSMLKEPPLPTQFKRQLLHSIYFGALVRKKTKSISKLDTPFMLVFMEELLKSKQLLWILFNICDHRARLLLTIL